MNNDISKEANTPVPIIKLEMLGYLDKIFPEKCAILGETQDSIFYAAGQRSVVRYLFRLYEEQQEQQFKNF